MPAIDEAMMLINAATSFLSLIPGLGGFVSGLKEAMNVANDIKIAMGPIMQTSKNIAKYVRGASDGKKALERLFNANDMNDAATALNQLTALAGGMGMVSGSEFRADPEGATARTVTSINDKIREARDEYNATSDPAVKDLIQERLKRLVDARRRANHTGNNVRALQSTLKSSARAAAIPGQQAQVAQMTMSAAATATTATGTGKVTVAAITEQTSAVTNSLANVSQQLTEQAGLQVATNESLDILVEDTTTRSVQEATINRVREAEAQRAMTENWTQGQNDAIVAQTTIDGSLSANSVRDFNAADILFR